MSPLMQSDACAVCGRRFSSESARKQHQAATHDNPVWLSKQPKPPAVPVCPICGKPAAVKPGKFGLKAECCGLWSWKLKPLVGRETHAARIRAHAAFDPVWKSGTLSRGQAYARLAAVLQISIERCHIAEMSATQALRVVAVVEAGRLSPAAPEASATAGGAPSGAA